MSRARGSTGHRPTRDGSTSRPASSGRRGTRTLAPRSAWRSETASPGCSATAVGGGQTSVTAVQRFLRGADVLLLRQGQADPAEQPSGRRIGLGRGVIGFLTLDMTASWVEVRSPSGTSYARIEDADPAVAI